MSLKRVCSIYSNFGVWLIGFYETTGKHHDYGKEQYWAPD